MLGPVVTQGVTTELLVAITNADGTPATGLTFASVQCQWLRTGDNSFTSKVLTGLTFVEKGNGFYGVTFDGATELNVVGQFAYVLYGAGLQTSQNSAQVVSVASLTPTTPVALPVCIVTGSVNGPDGEGASGVVISARLVGEPTIEVNVALTDDAITAQTDDNGVFKLTLVRLAVYEIFIPRVNYRRQITVPNLATVDLFSGIP